MITTYKIRYTLFYKAILRHKQCNYIQCKYVHIYEIQRNTCIEVLIHVICAQFSNHKTYITGMIQPSFTLYTWSAISGHSGLELTSQHPHATATSDGFCTTIVEKTLPQGQKKPLQHSDSRQKPPHGQLVCLRMAADRDLYTEMTKPFYT